MTSEPASTITGADARHRSMGPVMLVLGLVVAGLLVVWWFDPGDWGLPLCSFYATTGLCCPGCGATRATHELLHGHLWSALRCNALWVLGLPLAFYLLASEMRQQMHGRPLPGNLLGRPWFLAGLACLGLLFFAVRNIPAYPFTCLVPPG